MIFRVVNGQCLVADVPVEGSVSVTPEQRAHYDDGWLVAESCATGVLPLLQAAPQMFEFLRDLIDPAYTHANVPFELIQRATELVARVRPSAAPAVEYHPVIDDLATALFGERFTTADTQRKAQLRQFANLVDVFAMQSQEDQLRAFLPVEYSTLTFRDLCRVLKTHAQWQHQQALTPPAVTDERP